MPRGRIRCFDLIRNCTLGDDIGSKFGFDRKFLLGMSKYVILNHCRKVKRDSSLRRFYTIDAKNTSEERNLSSQLTLEPLRGAVQTRCTQKRASASPLECGQA